MNTGENNLRLNANENYFGYSKNVKKAIRQDENQLHLYPNHPARLEKAIADKYDLGVDNVIIAGGSVRLIDGIVQTFSSEGEEIVYFEKAFIAYKQIIDAHKRKGVIVYQSSVACKTSLIFSIINQKTKIIFIANPNNPTGTYIEQSELTNFLNKLPKNIIVVLDEAYIEYALIETEPDTINLLSRFKNLIILRTFSKIYGLAGLRIGYGLVNEELAAILKRNRIPYFINSFAENAALVALKDEKFIQQSATKNKRERKYLYNALLKSGFNVYKSFANFLYIEFETVLEQRNILDTLKKNSIIVCDLTSFGIPNAIRISIGDRKANKVVAKTLCAIKARD
jgi:histidinol-phosphate aminotransferase